MTTPNTQQPATDEKIKKIAELLNEHGMGPSYFFASEYIEGLFSRIRADAATIERLTRELAARDAAIKVAVEALRKITEDRGGEYIHADEGTSILLIHIAEDALAAITATLGGKDQNHD